ncbi:GTP-binding protein [Plesiocystis pacifica SIR-1]|uniref:GTPase Era n=1 Tax=Plesiocystis pacifica SIR-1 TaxID=391625 RepID=A6GFF7_9BACT|nr:GTPase Era [Plesiocystis pacifica]EDM75384.1 GTP-binding protein [Plesiocystis pacifica SIR-1]
MTDVKDEAPASSGGSPGGSSSADGQQAFRSGFVALCGRPNVGKSTLLNALLGEELAVATALPQTTRERMLGIWTSPRFQAVLVDTPGIHKPKSALNKYMVEEAVRGARDVDVILMLAEVPRVPRGKDGHALIQEWEPGPGAKAAVELLAPLGKPMVLVLTKCDLLGERDWLLPIIQRWQAIHAFAGVVPVSAVQGRGLEALREEVEGALPEGPAYYADDQLSDRSMRWHASELIRAELFERLGQELPYSSAVTIREFKELRERDRIEATIHVERPSQKGIVIGAKGKSIKAISIGARKRIEQLTGRRCELFLEVRVTAKWTKDPRKLEDLGYRAAEAAPELDVQPGVLPELQSDPEGQGE